MRSLQNITLMSTPVSILHEDLLWRIFMENAEFPEFFIRPPTTNTIKPLITARHCSQVCRRWRHIFLSSPSIWAKMIDLGSLEQKEDDWRQEVMSRAGQALLWVYGRITRPMLPFFLLILRNHWHRVQAIEIHEVFIATMHRQWIWDCLKESAPNLQKLYINLATDWHATPAISLFDDNAPALREIRVISYDFKFKPTAPWLRNLSRVTFSQAFSTQEILDALNGMPRLVHFNTENLNLLPTSHPIPVQSSVVHLPHLKMIKLRGDLFAAAIVLRSITPSRDCCLSVRLSMQLGGSLDAMEYEQYETATLNHIIPYFRLHPPSTARVGFSYCGYFVHIEDEAPTDGRRFRIAVACGLARSSAILKELRRANSFGNLQGLTIGLPLTDANSSQHPVMEFSFFPMDVFSSITTLTTTDYMVEWFLEHAALENQFLPDLTILRIHLYDPDPEFANPPYQRFVKHRKDMDMHISVLEIFFNSLHDVDFLEEHIGLVVRGFCLGQDLGEYTCGSGHPDRLRFETIDRQGLLQK
ncbi:hypothetical protein CPC08DRAFT_551879 [Agrocybe pediades]|nr:hypothetical protein CPC08DRAFT_551879 [Agrocybe pediades]